MNQERELFRNRADIITTHRALLSGTTYAMHQINSVRTHSEPPNRRTALIAFGTGVFNFLLAILIEKPGAWIAALVAVAVGLWLWMRAKTVHYLVLSTSSGEVRSLHSLDPVEVQRYATAISDAIVQRNA